MTLAARPPRPEDAAAVAALVNAYDAAYGGDGAWTVADVEDEWRTAADVWLVERAGELAGHATLRSSDRGRLQALGWTHPAHAGHGVGGLLVDLTERRAVELGGTAVVRNSVLAADGVACRLLEGRGYAAESRNLRMRIDLDALPRPPTPPPGVAVASFRPGVDDAEVDACVEEAFERRWTHQAEWRQAKAAEERFDPDAWIVAREGQDVCGVALCTPQTFGMGFVEALAVRARWRGRGIGAALLHEALRRLRAAGERSAGLSVDGDNPAAIRLYKRAGMHIAWAAVQYEREVGKRGPIPAAGHRPAYAIDRCVASRPRSHRR
ncbi:MAG TPA: GNAT family N-acetyltransferase [Gaiellales bacterium]|nr:GNAT family N-acetyltransferase [Gaiellales bacterium]